ncbi:MAG: Toluene efflux pump outer membrane protein TtgI precursor [Syntrophorhabdus sp. PtaU1.Bin058]|nr:MAG: Toluene efflux pump outer membrane protein TtgI precursor [Syntrophorhabdus sp. PtaU1.Bin058]
MKSCSMAVFIKPVLFLALSAMLCCAGCVTVGPDYASPDKQVSAAWHTPLNGGLSSKGMDPGVLAAWWTTLKDPQLSGLMEKAVTGNLDLKKAWARIREARASRLEARADYFPTLDASGSATRSYSSAASDSDRTNDLYGAGFDAAWELDIFGGVRRSVGAASADLEAVQEDLHDVLVSLLGEVAMNYVEVRTYQTRIAAAEENVAKQSETYQLVLWRQQAGLGDELAVQEALYNLESTRSQLPGLRSGLEEALNRIAVLLGEKPGDIHKQLEKSAAIPTPPSDVVVGVPADMLRRRPDVRRAERELAAQTARVGVATADLYPKFTLTGSIGIEVLSLNKLVSAPVRMYNFGPGISWPIFRGGAIRANIEVQSALQEQAMITYEKAVLNALEEVENVLAAYSEEQKKRESLRVAEKAARSAVEIALGKYEAGLIDFLDVLVAQRSLLSSQDQLAQSDGTVTSNLIKLYKALGGGWESMMSGGEKGKVRGKEDGTKD